MKGTAIFIGGGIAGLTSAIALRRSGWQVEIFEQAPTFGEVGAGISLWPNSLRALDLLGVGQTVRALVGIQATAGFRQQDGQWLFRFNRETLETAYGQTIVIQRARLLDILVGALPAPTLTHAARITKIRVTDDGVTVHHAQGMEPGDLLIGADGIHSVARDTFWPAAKPPHYAGYTTWRFITPPVALESESRPESSETWGSGERVGVFPLRDHRMYTYLTASVPPNRHSKDELAELKRRFRSWHEPIPALLDSVWPDAITHNDIYTIPPLNTYVKDHIALVGDAAHAMTPDLGEGGGMALEDTVELARALTNATDLDSGLPANDAIRRSRTQLLAKQSAQFGAIAQWSWPPAVALRNSALRLAPPALFLTSLRSALSWGME